jgi:hypothetical protein
MCSWVLAVYTRARSPSECDTDLIVAILQTVRSSACATTCEKKIRHALRFSPSSFSLENLSPECRELYDCTSRRVDPVHI